MDKCYYGSMKDPSELQKSSSGGFATSIAKYVIQRRGVVYGVAYTSDFRGAEYIRATTDSDIQKLVGSKYIYANNVHIVTGGVITDIESGRLVLLIGLPCIIAGVISILRKKGIETGNLITIDLVCGGATSEEVGKQYIDYLEKKYRAKVVEFSVRYKNPNWTPPYLRAVFDNGKVFCKQFYETEYGYAFDKIKRESCYSCSFKGDNHLSDITIGDGWGVSQDDQGYNPFGVSVAFVHTALGNSIIHELSDVVLFEGDAETMKQNNPRYLTPKKKSMQYDKLKADFQRNGLLRACRKAYGIKRRLMNAIPEEILCGLRSLKHNMERFGK